ncbi:MAG TPA: hypothetical protein VHY19_00460 [Steroidobacteraceae bacterium]|nr:hypothetical protein [Steroidobacteraceae bacterium]
MSAEQAREGRRLRPDPEIALDDIGKISGVRPGVAVLGPLLQAVPMVCPPACCAGWRAAGGLLADADSDPTLHIEVAVPGLHLLEQVCELE